MAPPRRRLALDALDPYLHQHAADTDEAGTAGRAWALAHLAGITRRHAQRVLTEGAIGEPLADVVAAALGMHPANLWPEWWTGTEMEVAAA